MTESPRDGRETLGCGDGKGGVAEWWIGRMEAKTKDITQVDGFICATSFSNLTKRRIRITYTHTDIIGSVSHIETSSALKQLSQASAIDKSIKMSHSLMSYRL